MSIFKRIFISILLAVAVLPVVAQEVADTSYVFHFPQGKDMFYVPWRDNGANLEAVLSLIKKHKDELNEGKAYISVSSYGDNTAEAKGIGHIRNLRVKSELITRAGVTERMFVTDRSFTELYGDSLSNVVVVTFPASVEKVARIVGAEAAAKVEAYNKEVYAQTHPQPVVKDPEVVVEPQTDKVAVTEAEQMPEENMIAEEPEQKTSPEPAKPKAVSHLTLRANLLRYITLTPDLGIEWRINRSLGIAVNGSYTSWTWKNNDRRYALWEVSPEIHYYIGKARRGYIGAMGKVGSFNIKLSDTGRQGDIIGGGIVGGYRLPLNKCLSLDFNLALGYLNADFDTYGVVDGVRVYSASEKKDWFGPINAGITLSWTLF